MKDNSLRRGGEVGGTHQVGPRGGQVNLKPYWRFLEKLKKSVVERRKVQENPGGEKIGLQPLLQQRDLIMGGGPSINNSLTPEKFNMYNCRKQGGGQWKPLIMFLPVNRVRTFMRGDFLTQCTYESPRYRINIYSTFLGLSLRFSFSSSGKNQKYAS